MTISSELLPLAVRKAPAGLLLGQDVQFYATRREHSAKPEGLQDWLDCLPGPRVELFARRPRPGWTCIGAELGLWVTTKGIEERERAPGWEQGELFAGEV